MHTLYLGPSWAVQSYESLYGYDDPVKTNLAKELNFNNYTQLAHYGDSNLTQLNKAKKFISDNIDLGPFRIFFVVNTSLDDSAEFYKTNLADFAKTFLLSTIPLTLVKELEILFYKELEQLDMPIAVVGSHTDIVDYTFNNNVTVIDPSWQNFIGSQCGVERFFGWPAAMGHAWMQGSLNGTGHYNVDFDPSMEVVFEINRVFDYWTSFVDAGLWCGVHPNIQGNQLYANHIREKVNQWFDNTDVLL